MAVARPSGSVQAYPRVEDLTVFEIPHGCFVKMHEGTWHAGEQGGIEHVWGRRDGDGGDKLIVWFRSSWRPETAAVHTGPLFFESGNVASLVSE